MSKNFYVTTPIFYVNDVPHIGHAYTSIAADILARFKRLDGYNVRFLTGTDEHGLKVAKAAEKRGITPQEMVEEVSPSFRALGKLLNLSNDNFIRTTEPRHYKAAQAMWQAMEKNGDIYLDKYSGWYALRDEAFYTEKELVDGPNGKKINPTSGAECEWVEQESYFFRLSAWQDRLLKFYEQNPDFLAPKSARNEVYSFVKGGLEDLSISRASFTWGVPVPGNPKHVMYVWVDALTNYLTELGYPQTDGEMVKFWPQAHHVMGKDIVRFHAVYWPAFLMAAGFAPPKRVYGHGWLINKGQKMSKSLGNVITPQSLVDQFGLDAVRYFFFREVPFGNDGEYTLDGMIRRINSDLANDYGNLVQRVLSFVSKNCEAKVPAPGDFMPEDEALMTMVRNVLPVARAAMDEQAIHQYLEAVWQVVAEANRYVGEQAPWGLKKTDPVRMATVLYVLCEVIRALAILTTPVMPESSGNILDLVGQSPEARNFAALESRIEADTPLPVPQGIFPRYVEKAEGSSA